MHKAIKWSLLGAGSVIAVVGAIGAYVVATFNPNDYRDDIRKAVKDRTGRTLHLEGDIGLSFFPSLGMRLGEATLSEPGSEREFARIGAAVVSVKVMPLLSKEVVVDAVEVKGLRALLSRAKSGKFNFDDLVATDDPAKPPEKSAPVKVDIARIDIAGADITFTDDGAGTRYRLSKLDLKTGRVANALATPIDLSATVSSDKDKAQLDTKLKGKLTFDLERKLYKLDGLDFSAQGSYAGLSDLKIRAKGDVEARMKTGEYVANGLDVAISGKRPGGEVDVKLDVPKLSLTHDKVDGGKIVLEARINDPQSKVTAKVTAGGVQGAFKSIVAGPLDADIETHGNGRTTKAKVTGSLAANLETRHFELAKLVLTARVSDPKLPGGSFDAAINGSARADIEKKTAALDFAGKLEESKVNGKVALTAYSPLALTFDVEADQLDADRLLGKPPAGKAGESRQEKGRDAAAKDDKVDLSALKDIHAAGTLRIGKLTLLKLKSAQVRADVKVAGGRLDVAPISAQLYQGTLNGSLAAQAADHAVFAVKQTLSGVAVGPLLRDAAQLDTLEGKGTVSADLSTRGATVAALKKALNGTAAVNLADGSIKGIDIAGTIRSARTKIQELRGHPVQSSNKAEKTDFTELKATFDVKNGVAHNDDLSMKSPLLRVSGAGDIDIGNDRLAYLLKATVVATSKGQGGRDAGDLGGLTVPVKLTGAPAAPQWSIDFAGMVTDIARQRLHEELLKRATVPSGGSTKDSKDPKDAKDALRDRLKGILGR